MLLPESAFLLSSSFYLLPCSFNMRKSSPTCTRAANLFIVKFTTHSGAIKQLKRAGKKLIVSATFPRLFSTFLKPLGGKFLQDEIARVQTNMHSLVASYLGQRAFICIDDENMLLFLPGSLMECSTTTSSAVTNHPDCTVHRAMT